MKKIETTNIDYSYYDESYDELDVHYGLTPDNKISIGARIVVFAKVKEEKIRVYKTTDLNPNINSIDIRKFVLIPPEVEKTYILELIGETSFKLNPIGGSDVLFTLDVFEVPYKEFEAKLEIIRNIKEKIKELQVNYLDDKKEKISFDNKISTLIATFLIEVNKEVDINSEQMLIVLQSILGNLYKQEIDGIEFLDEETLNYLSNATVSKILEEAKMNLNKAMINMLVQIRKLSILWFYESVSLDYYNLRTDRKEIPKLQELNIITLNNITYEKIPINIENRKYPILFSDVTHTLTTLDVGKKNQDTIIPLMFSVFVDSASIKWKQNYTEIIIEAIRRSKTEILHQIKDIRYSYDEKTIEELIKEQKLLERSFEFLYRLLTDFRNTTYSENRLLKRHYEGEFSRNLKRFLGGQPPQSIIKLSPIGALQQFDLQEKKIDLTINEVSELKYNTLNVIKELIKAKKEENPSLFEKTISKFQEVSENIASKTIAELMDKLLKK